MPATATARSAPTTRDEATRKREMVIKAEVLREIGARPGIMVMKLQSGVFNSLDGKHRVKVGVNGCPDTFVFQQRQYTVVDTVNPGGFQPHEKRWELVAPFPIAAEFKSALGRQRPEQKAWQAAWEAIGGTYVLVRGLPDILEVLEQQRG